MNKRGTGEGSVYFQESRQRWAGAVTLDNGRRKVLYGKTRREVARKLTAALQRKDQGLPFASERLTVVRLRTDLNVARPLLTVSGRPQL